MKIRRVRGLIFVGLPNTAVVVVPTLISSVLGMKLFESGLKYS